MIEAVSLQLEIRANVPDGYRLTQALLDEVIRYRVENGRDPEGFEIELIDWARGGTKRRIRNQDEAWERFGRLLQRGRVTIRLRSD